MRDTQRLRSKIAMLAVLAGGVGCSSPPTPEPVARRGDAKAADAKASAPGEREAEAKGDAKPRPVRDRGAARRAAAEGGDTKSDDPAPGSERNATVRNHNPGDDARFGPFAGDPPYIDGYNPEEETCPSGNWCGPQSAADKVSFGEATEDTLGCPARIGGARRQGQTESPISGPVFAGLSDKPNMQGTFNQHGTELARADGKDDTCCYHWFEYCSGRPHVGVDGPVQAEVLEGTAAVARAWTDRAGPMLDALSPALRARVALAWREDARAEHASVAAFARATLELMAVGAPPELLAGCQRAGLDEIDHARRCFSLAAAYGERALQPGPLPPLAPRSSELARLAADTFAEGCVGESIAALVAERSLRSCIDASVRATLEVIAQDEARHAALAWATVRWAIAEGGEVVRDAVSRRADLLRAGRRDVVLPSEDPDAAALADAGRLDARALAQAERDAWAEIINPLVTAAIA